MVEKMTKKEMYAAIAEVLEANGNTELVEFCAKEVAALEAKALKAKERAAAKKDIVDELKVLVAAALTSEPQTAAVIFDLVADEVDEVTIGKVRNRLTGLVNDGAVVKSEVKVTNGDKTSHVKAYALA